MLGHGERIKAFIGSQLTRFHHASRYNPMLPVTVFAVFIMRKNY